MKHSFLPTWMPAAALALVLPLTFAACSDDNEPAQTEGRHWTTNGGLKAADNLLFEGNVIGNGDQEFVFTGRHSLKRGTYYL